jgi:hypothetical protein
VEANPNDARCAMSAMAIMILAALFVTYGNIGGGKAGW